MNKDNVIKLTRNMVKERLSNEVTGHDWHHIERVTNTANIIAQKEKDADLFIVNLAALLHDLADDKVVDSEQEGINNIIYWLKKHKVEDRHINHIIEIIKSISFKGGNHIPVKTLEAKIVQDADRIDAIGAIGIARCFVYTGSKGRIIYDPSLKIREQMSIEEYRSEDTCAIQHFYEKLLKLKDLMNTESGYKIAIQRHKFMEEFLHQFYYETGITTD